MLESVRRRDMYGYELVEEVSKVVDVNEGTIYPLLKRLTNEHYFETYLRESTEGPPRKYYHLTAAGVLYRDSLEKEWKELTKKWEAFWRSANMDKKTFISELKQALSVLQEEELNDIISEYEQHIDMKQANGLTEEEAIADFGSLSHLTAEILEAYHVRADYAESQKEGREQLPEQREHGGILRQGKKWCADGGRMLWNGIIRWGRRLWEAVLYGKRASGRLLSRVKSQWKKHFRFKRYHDKERENMSGERGQQAEMIKISMPSGNNGPEAYRSRGTALFHKTGKGISAVAHWCFKLCLWAVRVTWNGTCIAFSLFCASVGVCCLFGLGTFAVLLLQGYPLIGVTLGCAGFTICSFSLAWLGVTLLWKQDREMEEGQHA